jgi:predicted ATPase
MLRSLTRAGGGYQEAELAEIRLAAQAMSTHWQRVYFLAPLAELYGKGGRATEGLAVLAEALRTIEDTGWRFYEPEINRLKGELLLIGAPDNPEEAEACFRQAIAVARRQSAKSLELRAVMSLSRLYQKQGKQAEARQMLAEIYGWFTEGFDTVDLLEAKALLQAVS